MTAKHRGMLITAQQQMGQAREHMQRFEFRAAMEWYASAASLVEYVVTHEPVTADPGPPSGVHEGY